MILLLSKIFSTLIIIFITNICLMEKHRENEVSDFEYEFTYYDDKESCGPIFK